MAKIFVIEDDESIRELVKVALQGYGHEVFDFECAEDALEELKHTKADLGIFDIMLPGMDGVEAVKEYRSTETNGHMAIIMLTAKSDEASELNGFDCGADEYISKPFSPKILTARVDALIRRSYSIDSSEVTDVGGIIIDKAAHIVKIDGQEIDLSFKEFELLTYFVDNKGLALSREKILNNVWNYDYFGDARTIDTHVKKLRKKLGDKGDYIKTIWGMGYKFEI